MTEACIEWDRAPLELISNAAPWRTFRWRHGQKHYSGTYWSATERAHVIYESRLELARLLFADFEPAVTRIIAQPFLIRAVIDKRVRRHVPDYLLLTDDGPVIRFGRCRSDKCMWTRNLRSHTDDGCCCRCSE